MGFLGALARCAIDFLIDERCHACGTRPAADAGGSLPLAAAVEVRSIPGLRVLTRLLCAPCAARVKPWNARVLLAPPPRASEAIELYPAFVTDERLLAAIHLLKFGRRECLAPWLARAMVATLPAGARGERGSWQVIAVPMHRRSRARRGFNQAELIARTIAAAWELPMVSASALVKTRRTRPQSALGRAERLLNLDGALCADAARVRGARLILVDDLVTTGATVRECARALGTAGALEVRVVCAGYRDDHGAGVGAFLQS
jgi:ComF family protein